MRECDPGRSAPDTAKPGLRKIWREIVAAAVLAGLLIPAPAGARDRIIETRPGVTVDIRVDVPEDAPAVLLLLEGGLGIISPGYKGFAHKAYGLFLRSGIGAALIGAPAKADGFRGGLDPRFRESAAHIADIDAVIRDLKRTYNLPVWVLGVSTGTRSAAAYATRRSTRIDGVVLVSSSTDPPNGTPIHELPRLRKVTVPLLAISHRDDDCQGTPPGGAAMIAKAATASPQAVAMIFSGGLEAGSVPCGVETHHALFGIEDKVVSAIAWFITRHASGGTRLSTLKTE